MLQSNDWRIERPTDRPTNVAVVNDITNSRAQGNKCFSDFDFRVAVFWFGLFGFFRCLSRCSVHSLTFRSFTKSKNFVVSGNISNTHSREKTNMRPVAVSSTLHLCSRNEEIFLISVSVVDLKVFDCAFACLLVGFFMFVCLSACCCRLCLCLFGFACACSGLSACNVGDVFLFLFSCVCFHTIIIGVCFVAWIGWTITNATTHTHTYIHRHDTAK